MVAKGVATTAGIVRGVALEYAVPQMGLVLGHQAVLVQQVEAMVSLVSQLGRRIIMPSCLSAHFYPSLRITASDGKL